MATQTTVIYNATALAGKDLTKSITNINQDAGAGVLENFASGINALTTNVYKGAIRVDKTNLDAGEQATPTLTLGQSSVKIADIKTASATSPFGLLVDINYSGDGKLSTPLSFDERDIEDVQQTTTFSNGAKIVYVDGAPKLKLILSAAHDGSFDGGANNSITVNAAETDNFAAASVTLNITRN